MDINDFRDGQRHDMWLPLQNVKMGRLHLAITVLADNEKVNHPLNNIWHLAIYLNKEKHSYIKNRILMKMEMVLVCIEGNKLLLYFLICGWCLISILNYLYRELILQHVTRNQ